MVDIKTCQDCQEISFHISECLFCEMKICRKCWRVSHGNKCYNNPAKIKADEEATRLQYAEAEKKRKEEDEAKWRDLTDEEMKKYIKHHENNIEISKERIEDTMEDIEKYQRWIVKDIKLIVRLPKRIDARKRAIIKRKKELKSLRDNLKWDEKRDFENLQIKDDSHSYYPSYRMKKNE